MWVHILKSKDQVLNKFEEWKAMVETQFGHRVKVLQSDNGGEYTSKAFDAFLSKHGLVRKTSAPLHTATKWSCGACQSHHCRDGKVHVVCTRPWT